MDIISDSGISAPTPADILPPDILRDVQAERESKDVVVIKRWQRDMTGSITAAIVLAQILYWHGEGKDKTIRSKIIIDGRVWIKKSRPQWGQECFLTEKETRTAFKQLEQLGIIDIAFIKEGRVSMMHVAINATVYAELRHSNLQLTKSQPKPRGYLKSAVQVTKSQHPLTKSQLYTLSCLSTESTESEKPESKTAAPSGLSGLDPRTDDYLQFAESLIKRTTDELISELGKHWINQYNAAGVRAGAMASGLTVEQLQRAVDFAMQNDFYRDELLNHASFSKGKRWVYLFNKSIQSPPPADKFKPMSLEDYRNVKYTDR